MSKIQIVFTAPDTDREKMEQILHDYDLVVGPFGQDSEKELTEFLNSKLPYLRAVSLASNHQIFLYLAPENSGWLIEQINRHSHQGLSKHCLAGLVLDTGDYHGSLPQLWAEASSFGGKKCLRYIKKSDVYCQPFISQVKESPWAGIFMVSSDQNEETRTVQTIAFLRIAYEAYKLQIPIWTAFYTSEERRTRTKFAGSKGYFVSGKDLQL